MRASPRRDSLMSCEECISVFRRYDSSGTGTIQRDAFMEVLRSLDLALPDDEFEAVIIAAGVAPGGPVQYESFFYWLYNKRSQNGGSAEEFHVEVQRLPGSAAPADQKTMTEKAAQRRSVAAGVLGVVELEGLKLKLSTTRETAKLPHKDEVLSLSFSSDSKSVVAGGEDGVVALWNLETRARKCEGISPKRTGIACVRFAPSGRYVVSADINSNVTLWDATTGAEIKRVTAKGDDVTLAMATVQEAEILAIGSTANKAMLYTIPGLDLITELDHGGNIHTLSFSPNGSLLAGGGGTDSFGGLMTKKVDGHEIKTVIWSVASRAEECKMLTSIQAADIVHAAAFCPSGKLLAVGGEDCTITTLRVDADFQKNSTLRSVGGVRCLAWTSDSRFLASGGEDLQVSVWDVIAEVVAFQLPKVTDWILSVSFSPDAQWLAHCGNGSNEVRLYPIELVVKGKAEDDEEQAED